ncbi:signal transduction histidine kinase [Halarchaeum rubridurum]|uniref:histidine kinase n=1 Tax=Halarchaeum rubridurum TaxID=489911 RepID=A0A830G2V9_9EURY|nr:HAMP domain-containing sensor histidine kinase [Halarchaeum rubridurum]MBP1955518.1 signal transduction histidine kinase [Halarchaeum rubridurum]GGM72964.1 hypothetical protein GCM10009017_23700 [Halarchaeum rubridurum]
MSGSETGTLGRDALGALPSQLALLDDDGEIVYTNDEWSSFARENGFDGDPGMVGTNYLAVCERSASEDATAAAAGIRDVMSGSRERFAYEYPCHGPDERRWFLMRALTYDSGGETYVLVMHLNITERKLAELEAADRSERLEAVARILSHDLKNPLGIAKGRAELLAAQAGDGAAVTDHVEGIESALDHMDEILTDALLFARDDFDPETEPVSVGDAARGAWAHVDADLDFAVESEATIAANRPLLRHVLENLLRNAADHGGSRVVVGATTDGFYVADDGPGIPTGDREAVFRPDVSTSAGHASGLGLTIVREAAAVHGWSVSATDASSGGARFDVSGVAAGR